MPFGFGIRIMPGVRLRASTRGIGVGVGPRAARLNVGTRGVGVSTGAGPFWAATGVSPKRSRRSSSRGSSRQSLRAYDRELKRAQREQEVAEVAEKEQQLLSVHLEEFPPAQPPLAPEPEPIDRHAILNNFTNQALSDIPWYKRSERRAAKQAAVQQAEQAIREEEHRRIKERTEKQASLDATWHQLLNNDPQTVLTVLEEAFEDNQAPAAPINCEGDDATVMMLYETPDLVPDRKPTLTPSGKPTLHKRSKTERNEFYAASLASNVLATAKEAFAVAPGIKRVAVMVVHKDESPQLARPVLSCLYCGRFEHSRFKQLDWSRISPLTEILNAPGALIQPKGRTAEIVPLDISEISDLATVLKRAAEELGCVANINPTNTGNRSNSRTDTENRQKKASEQQRSSEEQKEHRMIQGDMEKHTISVGTDTIGETVSFTAKLLGTAKVNGGNGSGGLDLTVYRLPDNTYRVLAEKEGISLLEPSNFVQVLGTGQTAEYGRWTYEEAAADKTYGEMFTKFMAQHPEGIKRNVRDLD